MAIELGINPSASVENAYAQMKQDVHDTVIKGILESVSKDSEFVQQIKRTAQSESSLKGQQYSSGLLSLASDTLSFFDHSDNIDTSMMKSNSTSSREHRSSLQRDDLRAKLQNNQDIAVEQRSEAAIAKINQGNNEL